MIYLQISEIFLKKMAESKNLAVIEKNLLKNTKTSVVSQNIKKPFLYFSLRIEIRIHQKVAFFFNKKN